MAYPAEDLRGGYIEPGLCNVGIGCPFPGETGLLGGLLTTRGWVVSSWVKTTFCCSGRVCEKDVLSVVEVVSSIHLD